MNYKGKHGKNYEIPTIIKRCCFSDTGHKVLMQEGLFNYKIQDPLSVIDDKFLFCMEFDRAIHEIEDNLGISSTYKQVFFSDDEFVFQILDPILYMFERMNIPRKEAIKIHGSHYERKEYKVGQLLEEYYDLDTIVEVYNKEGELLIKENALNILVLNYLSDCEILDYYDNCYADQSISITPKGVIIPVLYDEIYERLCIKS